MPRNRATIDPDEEDDFNDPEDPEEYDQDENDEPDDCVCPHCGASVYESADICPKCHSFITYEEAAGMKRPRWVVWVAVVLLAAMGLSILGYLSFH